MHDIPCGVVGAVAPAIGIETGADPGFAEGAIELRWASGGHEEDIGAFATIRMEAGGGGDIDVRGAEIGLG